jgi:oxygen-independent coproporphyrinogen-3 oxidase
LFTALRQGGLHRNFQGYSTRAEAHLIGFGVSAISRVRENYFQNVKKLEDYETAISNGAATVYRGYKVTLDDKIRHDVIMTWMCQQKVDFASFEKRYNINFKKIFLGSIE